MMYRLIYRLGITVVNGTTVLEFSSCTYGWVRNAGDTVWSGSYIFNAQIGQRRSVTLVAKDGCGNVKSVPWAVTPKPTVGGAVTVTRQTCNGFSASITDSANLTNPQYCLYTATNTLLHVILQEISAASETDLYYINITDVCYDTVIRRDFSAAQPVPYLAASITVSRTSCSDFTATPLE
jgi:hypothetical protein